MKCRKAWMGACILIAALAGGPAAASGVADTVTIAPAFRALAMEIITFTGADTLSHTMARLSSDQIVAELRKAFPGFDDSAATIVREEIRKTFDENQQSLATMVVQLYARHFTEAELRDMLAFYHTPAGAKMVHEMPEILQETMLAGRAWGEHVAPIVIERIQKRMSPPAAPRKS